jgi:hypothetical protein
MGDSFYGPGTELGEPTPEGKRPYGWAAWIVGVAVWLALMSLVGLLVWILR